MDTISKKLTPVAATRRSTLYGFIERQLGAHVGKIGSLLVLLLLGTCTVGFMKACQSDDSRIETAARAMPEDEKAFVSAVAEYGGSKFIDANALQAFPLRQARAAALCSTNRGGAVKNWVGRVEEISATNRGDAIMRVYLYGDGVAYLENWNEKTNSDLDKLPVAQGTHLFTAIAGFKPLQLIRFDGELQLDDNDCFRTNGSQTADDTGNLAATMMSPTFIIRWTSVQPLD